MNDNERDIELMVYTTSEAAEMLKVTEETVRKKAQSKELIGFKTGRSDKSHWRFSHQQLVDYMVSSVSN